MTPKEKATELVNKFNYLVLERDFFGDNIEHKNSKQCALIAVSEMKSEINRFADNKYRLDRMSYLDEVTVEIINL